MNAPQAVAQRVFGFQAVFGLETHHEKLFYTLCIWKNCFFIGQQAVFICKGREVSFLFMKYAGQGCVCKLVLQRVKHADWSKINRQIAKIYLVICYNLLALYK